jgi:hypothetical protein
MLTIHLKFINFVFEFPIMEFGITQEEIQNEIVKIKEEQRFKEIIQSQLEEFQNVMFENNKQLYKSLHGEIKNLQEHNLLLKTVSEHLTQRVGVLETTIESQKLDLSKKDESIDFLYQHIEKLELAKKSQKMELSKKDVLLKSLEERIYELEVKEINRSVDEDKKESPKTFDKDFPSLPTPPPGLPTTKTTLARQYKIVNQTSSNVGVGLVPPGGYSWNP